MNTTTPILFNKIDYAPGCICVDLNMTVLTMSELKVNP